jgi:phosphoglycolate phosphatase-like HAD superfamily hydrolase
MDARILRDFVPAKEFFVGIDSDGCVFDSMEIKQKECFAPMFIKHFHLQAASKYARQVWEHVNLYSKDRGCNRFLALILVLELLRKKPEVVARNVAIPSTKALQQWTALESKLSNQTLEAEVQRGNQPLAPVLAWSRAVNAAIEDIVKDVPPFPCVRPCLEIISQQADAMVVSQTPTEALRREWKEHHIDGYVRLIAGQELGSKTQHLELAARGKYAPNHILMIGDAPGDYKAATANDALFYPIVPGAEERSWERLLLEGLPRFFKGLFAGAFARQLLEEFDASLQANG